MLIRFLLALLALLTGLSPAQSAAPVVPSLSAVGQALSVSKTQVVYGARQTAVTYSPLFARPPHRWSAQEFLPETDLVSVDQPVVFYGDRQRI